MEKFQPPQLGKKPGLGHLWIKKWILFGAMKLSLKGALKFLTKFCMSLTLLIFHCEDIMIFDAIIINMAIYFRLLIRLTQFIRRLMKFNLIQIGAHSSEEKNIYSCCEAKTVNH